MGSKDAQPAFLSWQVLVVLGGLILFSATGQLSSAPKLKSDLYLQGTKLWSRNC